MGIHQNFLVINTLTRRQSGPVFINVETIKFLFNFYKLHRMSIGINYRNTYPLIETSRSLMQE